MTFGAFLTLLQGAGVTVLLSLCGILIGVPAGLALALLRSSRIAAVRAPIAAYVSVVRATPLVTLALLIFFAVPVLGIKVDPIPAAVLTLTLNTAAFNSEIWRAGLLAFPRDERDAATAFGMTRSVAFRRIVMPQLWRTCLPALVNEMSLLIKGSPAIAVLGVVEITRAAVRIGAETYEPLPPFLVATVLYALVVYAFLWAQRMLEARQITA
jgi:His/Glu/Gln/Arg/opine family amino acid ABC transporter permease subunit